MLKFQHIGLFLSALLLQVSCMKDKGNYRYTAVNRITITGIDSSYTINYGEKLKITPKLAFTQDPTGDTANYSFMWVANHMMGYLPNPQIIATSRDLDINGTLGLATYFMYYRVTDKRTNVFTETPFYLTIGTPSYEGWLLLCDVGNGNSRLDMVSRQGNLDTIYPDILRTVSSSFSPAGAPVFVETAYTDFLPGGDIFTVFLATSKQFVFLGGDTLDHKPSNDMQYALDIDRKVTDWSNAQLYMTWLRKGLLALDGNIYLVENKKVTGPINTTAGSKFNASRWLAFDRTKSINPGVFFDVDNGAFYRYPGSGTECVPYTNGTLFDFTTGKVMLYLQFVPFNGGEVYAVLQDKRDNKKYLARFALNGTQTYYGEITGEGIAVATQFAASPNLGYLFYNAGGKIYEHDAINNRTILMKDYGNRAVSQLKFQQFSDTYDGSPNRAKYADLSEKLVVCTYQEGALSNSGTMDIYNVPEINKPLQLYRSYSGGIGKVVSVSYRDR